MVDPAPWPKAAAALSINPGSGRSKTPPKAKISLQLQVARSLGKNRYHNGIMVYLFCLEPRVEEQLGLHVRLQSRCQSIDA